MVICLSQEVRDKNQIKAYHYRDQGASQEYFTKMSKIAAEKLRRNPHRPDDWRFEFCETTPDYGPELVSTGWTSPTPAMRWWLFNC